MDSAEKVIIRYCGGCNPRYDRVLVAERLKEEIENAGIEADSITLVMCGCTASCAYKKSDKENPLAFKITSEEDAREVLRKIKESR